MFGKCRLNFFQFLTMALCFFMMIFFGTSYFYANRVAKAEEEEIDIEELIPHLSNFERTEEEIDEEMEMLTEPYYEAISFDEEGVFLEFNPDGVAYPYDCASEVVNIITNNINTMNELVEEGFGYIDENYEFQPNIDEVGLARFNSGAIWGFRLKWNKVSAKMNGNFAIYASMVFLMSKILFGGAKFQIEKNLPRLTDEAYLDQFLETVASDCVGVLGSKVATIFNEDRRYNILTVLQIGYELFNASSLYLKLLNIVISLLLPSVVDCAIVLYATLVYNKTTTITGCWVGFGSNRLGVSMGVDKYI